MGVADRAKVKPHQPANTLTARASNYIPCSVGVADVARVAPHQPSNITVGTNGISHYTARSIGVVDCSPIGASHQPANTVHPTHSPRSVDVTDRGINAVPEQSTDIGNAAHASSGVAIAYCDSTDTAHQSTDILDGVISISRGATYIPRGVGVADGAGLHESDQPAKINCTQYTSRGVGVADGATSAIPHQSSNELRTNHTSTHQTHIT